MAWLAGWQYRKKITIQGRSGAGQNYVILLKIGESSGSSGCDFHLEGQSANFPSGKNDGGDLRFTASDGITLLSFWVEKVEGSSPNRTAYVWVKVSENLDNNVDIYCYFGNSEASNYSNGDNTFLLFDDFEGSSLDSNKWEWRDASVSVSNSVLTVSENGTTGRRVQSKNSFSGLLKMLVYIKYYMNQTYELLGIGYCDGSGFNASNNSIGDNENNFSVYRIRQYQAKEYIENRKDGGSRADVVARSSLRNNTWFRFYFLRASDKAIYIEPDAGVQVENASNYFSTSINAHVGIDFLKSQAGYFDYIALMKLVYPEPAFLSAGPVEVPPKGRCFGYIF